MLTGYFFLGSGELKKSKLITQRETLPRTWAITLKVNPYNTVNVLSNILHATIGKDNERYGDRIPGIWFLPKTTKLFICSAVNGNKNLAYLQFHYIKEL